MSEPMDLGEAEADVEATPAAGHSDTRRRALAVVLLAWMGFTVWFAALTEASSGHDFSYRLGESAVPVGVCSVVVWFVIRSRQKVWPLLLAPIAIGLASFALIVLEMHGSLEGVSIASADRMDIAPPQVALGLQKMTNAASLQAVQQVTSMASSVTDAKPVVAVYGPRQNGSGGVGVVLVGYNINPGSRFERQSIQDQRQGMSDFAAGAHLQGLQYFDAGSPDATLGCGVITPSGRELRVCMWIAPGRVGEILFVTPTSPETAAQSTREIRAASEAHAVP